MLVSTQKKLHLPRAMQSLVTVKPLSNYLCGLTKGMKGSDISLCISTYNWPGALHLCLQSVLAQTVLPKEVIIGDDGSGPETRTLIEQWEQRFTIPLVHVWQPDEGFKLAQIRNKSFAKATGQYIVQIDGDLVLHPGFIADHARFARTGCFVTGARSLINPPATQQLIQAGRIDEELIHQSLTKKYNALHLPLLGWLNYFVARRNLVKYVLGANMAFFKQDLLLVNGYNETFTGWGKEDNDLAIRLCNAGLALHSVKFAAVIYHLYHKEADRHNISLNEGMLKNTIAQRLVKAPQGLDQYL
jgi:glycosyltransferase involved in cell wall biosynthesis